MRDKIVSIIVATHKREKLLARSITSLLGLDYPKNEYETIVVSDSGTRINRRIESTISKILGDLGLNRTMVNLLKFTKRMGLTKARNVGLRVAKGEIIAFIDDDVVVHKDWLKNLMRAYHYGHNIGAVGGRIAKGFFNNIIYSTAPIGTFGWGGHTYFNFHIFRRCKVDWVRGCNMSFRRAVLDEIGGFDEALGDFSQGEDMEVCLRVASAGYDIIFEPKAVVLHKEAPMGGVRNPPVDLAYWYMRNSTYIFLKSNGPKKLLIIPRRFISILILCVRRAARDKSANLCTVSKILVEAIRGLIQGMLLKFR